MKMNRSTVTRLQKERESSDNSINIWKMKTGICPECGGTIKKQDNEWYCIKCRLALEDDTHKWKRKRKTTS